MSHKVKIDVNYVARVEGETAIHIELGERPAIELKIFEPPRFFEGFLVGRKYDEVGDIVSRICGICPVSHMTTAILAVEKAMDVRVTAQTAALRRLMSISQIAASHLIHLYMLAMPDYYGYTGIPEMLPGFRREIKRLLKIKEVMNDLTAVIGGRALHPVTHVPGGFTAVPDRNAFRSIWTRLQAIKKDAAEVVRDVSRFALPFFSSPTEYLALDKDDEYAINDGRIKSTAGLDIAVEEYADCFVESQVDYAFAKKIRMKARDAVMVGALARLQVKFAKLQPETKELAAEVGFPLPGDNPFHNLLAQSLEVYDGILRCRALIGDHDFKEEDFKVQARAGEGGAVTEAPRGLLYHWYRIDRKGIVEQANIVTPTVHNFLSMEKDLKKLVGENIRRTRDEIRLLAEKLIRAYDPCFSCSVH